MDLDRYRAGAEQFTAEHTGEYLRHFAGHSPDFDIEPIYERHAALFERDSVEALGELARDGAPGGDAARGARMLWQFAVEGHLGQATKAIDAELARREADLKLAVDGRSIGFRESSIEQANEPDPEARERIELARMAATESELNPLAAEALQLVHGLARDLGWTDYAAMFAEVLAIDLRALERQTEAFTAATDAAYPALLDPVARRTLGHGTDALRRSDLPFLFRAREADPHFPEARLVGAFEETLGGMGIELRSQRNVHLDVERRPGKSPRAFCAPVRVPGEVHLVVPPMGGRDDYLALFHEGGHTEHFANVDPGLPFEFRMLGDNSVTEGFAFLFDHLIEDPEWLRRKLGVDDEEGTLAAHARAVQLLYARRYAAKLSYELELHADGRPLEELADVYSRRLGHAVGVDWPRQSFLTDVDPGFYAASYLRAWSLETHLRAALRERFGPAWFEEPAAGDWLRTLWREGQRLPADELLSQVAGAELDFGALLADLELSAAS